MADTQRCAVYEISVLMAAHIEVCCVLSFGVDGRSRQV